MSYRVTDLMIDCLRLLRGEIGALPRGAGGDSENGTGGDAAERLPRAIDRTVGASWVDVTVTSPTGDLPAAITADPPRVLESERPPITCCF